MMSVSTPLSSEAFRISLVGAGRVGSLIAKRLHQKGYHFRTIHSRSLSSAKQLAAAVAANGFTNNVLDLDRATNLILITTPDGAIESVAESLSHHKLKFQSLFVGHVSGALSSDALAKLRDMGAYTFSMHPIQTFATADDSNLADVFNCYFGLESAESEAVEVGKKLIHDLGGKVLFVPKAAKTLYHISAVMLSNYLVTLTALSAEIFSGLGLKSADSVKIFEPLIAGTIRNLKSAETASDALTGPIERGDIETIKRHLTELADQLPHLIPVYSALAMETVRLAVRKESLSQTDARKILSLLEEFTRKESNL
jgi:predicted short-subunit dehydrogenase-like oxidoreductase (DUF2520 family)